MAKKKPPAEAWADKAMSALDEPPQVQPQQQPLPLPPQEQPQVQPEPEPQVYRPATAWPSLDDTKPASKMDCVRQALAKGIEEIAEIVAYARKHGFELEAKMAGVYKSNIKRAKDVATSRTRHPSESRVAVAQGPSMEDVIGSLVEMKDWTEVNGGLDTVLEAFSVVEMCREKFGSYEFCRGALLAIRKLMK